MEGIKDDLLQDNELEEVFTQDFGNWEVKDDGSIIYKGNSLGTKSFPKEKLKWSDLTQMLGKVYKDYKDARDYYFAYLEALKRAGYKKMTIDLTNIHIITFE